MLGECGVPGALLPSHGGTLRLSESFVRALVCLFQGLIIWRQNGYRLPVPKGVVGISNDHQLDHHGDEDGHPSTLD